MAWRTTGAGQSSCNGGSAKRARNRVRLSRCDAIGHCRKELLRVSVAQSTGGRSQRLALAKKVSTQRSSIAGGGRWGG